MWHWFTIFFREASDVYIECRIFHSRAVFDVHVSPSNDLGGVEVNYVDNCYYETILLLFFLFMGLFVLYSCCPYWALTRSLWFGIRKVLTTIPTVETPNCSPSLVSLGSPSSTGTSPFSLRCYGLFFFTVIQVSWTFSVSSHWLLYVILSKLWIVKGQQTVRSPYC